jgi:ribosomal-protein-alanine N-acetyltransferase
MPLLCFDTATSVPVVALCDGDGTLLAGGIVDGRAQGVLGLIDRLCTEAGLARDSIDAIVVGTGPGTFTGLRVGVTTARGLGEALQVPVHGVPTFDIARAGLDDTTGSVVSLAAGRGECFVQRRPDGPVETIALVDAPDPTPLTPAGLAMAAADRVARAGASDDESGSPLAVTPKYGRAPDATPPRLETSIDTLRVDDLDALITLEQRCFDEPWTHGMYADELARPAGDAVRLAARDTGSGGRLVGAAIAARIGGAWHVMNVLVDPSARGRRIGSRLVDDLLLRTAELGPGEGWTLEVRDGNDAAIALYEHRGFTVAGRRPGYYAETGEDALVMWRYATAGDAPPVRR